MKSNDKLVRYLRNIALMIIIFYIGLLLGYTILGKGSLFDALSLKPIRHIKEIIYN